MDWLDTFKLRIANHRLFIDVIDSKPAPWRATPNLGGPLRPELIVLHETASRLDAAGSISWLCNPSAKASAHTTSWWTARAE